MTRRWIPAAALLLAIGFAAPSVGFAQGIDARVDDAKDEVKASKDRVKDAKKDLKAIKKIRAKWEKAREKGKEKNEAKADVDLADWVREELAEDRAEAGDAAREVRRGGGDPTPDKGEKPAMHGPEPERPALADDQRDLAKERADLAATREIAMELKEMQPKFTHGNAGGPMYKKKSGLLEKLQRGAARDLSRAEKELEEDEAKLDRLKDKR